MTPDGRAPPATIVAVAAGTLGLAAAHERGVAAFLAVALAAWGVGAWGARPAWLARAASLGLAVAACASLLEGDRSASAAVALGLGWLLAYRGLTLGPHDRTGLTIPALMLISSGAFRPGPLVFAATALWAVAVPVALLPARSRGRWAVVGPAVAALAALVFAVLPRFVELRPPALDTAPTIGFAPEIRLDESDGLPGEDGTVLVIRTTPPFDGPIYLRGMALDRFDGRGWSSDLDPAPMAPPRDTGTWTVDVDVRAPGNGLFTVGRVRGIDAGTRILRTSSGSLLLDDPVRRYRLSVDGPLGDRGEVGGDLGDDPRARGRWLALPPLDPRIGALAATLGRGDAAAARALAYFDDFTYTHDGFPTDADPLATFLFERKAGHCEFYASGLAVLLRSAGVPARVVSGYAAVATGGVAEIRSADAHAWVEAWVDGSWVRLDATPGPGGTVPPPRWDLALEDRFERWLAYDVTGQAAVAAAFAAALRERAWTPWGVVPAPLWAVGAAAGAVGALGLVWRRYGGLPTDPVERAHARVRRRLARAGFRIPESLPPLAAARWVAARTSDADGAAALERLVDLLYRTRWGGEASAAHGQEARTLLERASRLRPDRVTVHPRRERP